MNIKTRILLFALFSITVSNAVANSCSPCNTTKNCSDKGNKTFLMPRSYNYNLALDTTAGWWELTHRAHLNSFGGNFSLTAFYESSERDEKLGKYFSPQHCQPQSTSCASTCNDCPGNNNFTFGARLGANQAVTEDLNLRSFIQMPFPDLLVPQTTSTKNVTMNLEMNRRAYGFNLNYHHTFDSVLRGFFFTVKIPVVHVEHNVDVSLTGNDWNVGARDQDLVKAATSINALADFFNGRDVELPLVTDNPVTEQLSFNTLNGQDIFATNSPLQEALTCGLIPVPTKNACNKPCPTKDRSISGIADIDLSFGYHFVNQEIYHVALSIGGTIPTGNAVKNHYLWEPILGNGRNWALGIGAEGEYKAWGTRDHNINLIAALNFRYLFENCQQRILGLCGVEWGQYRLIAKVGEKKLVPAANLLCQKVDVTPGAMVDFIAQATWNYRGLGIDLGYNLYYRQTEKVSLHDCRTIFEKEKYAFPAPDFNGEAAEFTADDRLADATGNKHWLSDSKIDKTRAETPEQLTHKLYGSLSYLCTKRHLPVIVGITGHYEFASEDTDLESWGVALKLGVSF